MPPTPGLPCKEYSTTFRRGFHIHVNWKPNEILHWHNWRGLHTIIPPCSRKSLQSGGLQNRLPTQLITHIGKELISLLENIHCFSTYGDIRLGDIFFVESDAGLHLGLRSDRTQSDNASYQSDMHSLGFILLYLFGAPPWCISKTRENQNQKKSFLADPRASLLGDDEVGLPCPVDHQVGEDLLLPRRKVSLHDEILKHLAEYFELVGEMSAQAKPDYDRLYQVLSTIDTKFRATLI